MNKIILMGRLTRDPEIRSYGYDNKILANITLAVDRRFKREGEPTADFFSCTAFGAVASVLEKYCKKGTKLLVEGECQDNNYDDKNGIKHYSKRVVIANIEFCESKGSSSERNSSSGSGSASAPQTDDEGWMNVPEGTDEKLPFD